MTLDAVLAANLESVIGFSVGGIEVERAQFAPVFDRARAAGLHSVPHAGETDGPDRIWAAVDQLGAERISHGIRCLDDPHWSSAYAPRNFPSICARPRTTEPGLCALTAGIHCRCCWA